MRPRRFLYFRMHIQYIHGSALHKRLREPSRLHVPPFRFAHSDANPSLLYRLQPNHTVQINCPIPPRVMQLLAATPT